MENNVFRKTLTSSIEEMKKYRPSIVWILELSADKTRSRSREMNPCLIDDHKRGRQSDKTAYNEKIEGRTGRISEIENSYLCRDLI